jgi:hypothetical protein
MSADLFAEFESPSQATPRPAPTTRPRPSAAVQHNSFATDPFAAFGTNSAGPTAHSAGPYQQQPSQWPSFEQPAQPQVVQQEPDHWGDFHQSSAPGANQVPKDDDDDDDGWGDFEVADSKPQVSAMRQAPSPPKPTTPQALNLVQPVRTPQTTSDKASMSFDLLEGNISIKDSTTLNQVQRSFEQPTNNWARNQTTAPQHTPKNSDPNVLFDAEDFNRETGASDEEDDEFGSFESGKPESGRHIFSQDYLVSESTRKEASLSTFSDLSLTNDKSTFHYRKTESNSSQPRTEVPRLGVQSPTRSTAPSAHGFGASAATSRLSRDKTAAKESLDVSDDWGAFEEAASTSNQARAAKPASDSWDWDSLDPQPQPRKLQKPVAKTYQAVSTANADQSNDNSWDWDSFETEGEAPSKTSGTEPPPTNVPPPAILLSVFPQLLGQANESLYKPVAGQSATVKNRILSDPKTVEYVRAYLLLAIVAARVVAGRKVRWHRDKFLAQGMSISAAGAKGMKLAGVDKTQAAREDREAADILDLWKAQVGRLRSSVAAVNAALQNSFEHLKLPELRDNMAIQTTKDVPTAAKACVVCGLKREERIPRVDLDVEDSFGEWWTEHWGHTTCKRFWLQHKDALRSR